MPEKPTGPILPTPEPHTLVKHAILKKYLNAWFPILTSPGGFPRVFFIDGFAGSGIYEDGSKGSPIIAIEAALNQPRQITKELNFIFIERDKERAATLDAEVRKLQNPTNFHYFVRRADFTQKMPEVINHYKTSSQGFSGAFVFIDPFGYKGIPIDLIKDIMKNRSCEVLITFMYDEINRFLSVEESDSCRDDLFGTTDWVNAEQERDPKKRRQILHDLYQKQLKEYANIQYVRSFQMINIRNTTDFYLFFGTNNPEGLREMKRAMWKADESGSYHFSDNTNPNQTVMFSEPDYDELKKILKKQFSGKEVALSEVERFVLEETPFRDDAHLKRPVLTPMEQNQEIQVFEPDGTSRKSRGFRPDMKIRFQ